jgi:hypothetical protein
MMHEGGFPVMLAPCATDRQPKALARQQFVVSYGGDGSVLEMPNPSPYKQADWMACNKPTPCGGEADGQKSDRCCKDRAFFCVPGMNNQQLCDKLSTGQYSDGK